MKSKDYGCVGVAPTNRTQFRELLGTKNQIYGAVATSAHQGRQRRIRIPLHKIVIREIVHHNYYLVEVLLPAPFLLQHASLLLIQDFLQLCVAPFVELPGLLVVVLPQLLAGVSLYWEPSTIQIC